MDVLSYLLGKQSGGGGASYNVLIDTTLTYETSNKISSLIKEINTFTIDDSLTTFQSLFYGCSNIEELPKLDTKNITDMSYCCYVCKSLVTAPDWNTKNVAEMGSFFYGCTNLANVPVYDTTSLLHANNMFNNCTSLTDESLDNILQMCINAKSFTGTPTLYYLGLRKTKYSQSKLESLPHWDDFVAAGWESGYF